MSQQDQLFGGSRLSQKQDETAPKKHYKLLSSLLHRHSYDLNLELNKSKIWKYEFPEETSKNQNQSDIVMFDLTNDMGLG